MSLAAIIGMLAELKRMRAQLSQHEVAIGEHKVAIGAMGAEVHRQAVILAPARSSPVITRQAAELLYSPKVMQVQLASGGIAPLPLDGLQGATAKTQSAAIPQVPALPQLGDPNYKPSSGILVNVPGQGNFRRGASGWEPLSTSPSVSVAAPAVSAGGVGGSSGSYAGISQQATSTPWFGTPTSTRAIAVTYQNLTGLPLFVSVSFTLSTPSPAFLFSDSNPTPAAKLAEAQQSASTSAISFQLCGWVLPGNYYVISAGTLLEWTENI